MKDGKLLVTSVSIKNVLGATAFAFEPGKVSVLRGRNGSGKSTALTAVQKALEGGNLAKLQKVGSDEDPEVVLVIEGDGEEYRVEKTGKRTASVLKRVGDTAAFEDVPRPQDFLNALFDARGCNPVAFLTAKSDDRAEMLLQALDLKLDRAELDAIIGDLAEYVPALPPGLHPLAEVDLVRDGIFRARTGVNRDAKNKAGAADQTKRNAPAKVPDDPQAEIKEAEGRIAKLTSAVAREESEATAAEKQALIDADSQYRLAEERAAAAFQLESGKLRRQFDGEAAEIRAEAERRVAKLKDATDAKVAELGDAGEKAVAEAETRRDDAREVARRAREEARVSTDASKRALAGHREEQARLVEQAKSSAAARALLAQAKQFEDEAAALEEKGGEMSAAIVALDGLKRRLAESLPIDGLALEGKEITVNGIPFDQINHAGRIDIAVRVAMLRANAARLPVLFVDDAESLDDDTFALFVERIKREDVQLFCGRVEAHDFKADVLEPVGA